MRWQVRMRSYSAHCQPNQCEACRDDEQLSHQTKRQSKHAASPVQLTEDANAPLISGLVVASPL